MVPLVQPRQPLCDEKKYIHKLLLLLLLFIDLSTELMNLHEHKTTQKIRTKTNQKKAK
jgi:hypothetical protein